MLASLTRGEMTRGSRGVGHSRRRPQQAHMGRQVARLAVARRSGSRLVHPRPARYPSLYVANAVPDRRAPRRGCSRDYRRSAPGHTAARRHCDALHRFRSETRARRRGRPRRCSRWRAFSLARVVSWALIASPRERWMSAIRRADAFLHGRDTRSTRPSPTTAYSDVPRFGDSASARERTLGPIRRRAPDGARPGKASGGSARRRGSRRPVDA